MSIKKCPVTDRQSVGKMGLSGNISDGEQSAFGVYLWSRESVLSCLFALDRIIRAIQIICTKIQGQDSQESNRSTEGSGQQEGSLKDVLYELQTAYLMLRCDQFTGIDSVDHNLLKNGCFARFSRRGFLPPSWARRILA